MKQLLVGIAIANVILLQAWLVREAFSNKMIYTMQGSEIRRLRESVKGMNDNLNKFFFDVTTSEIFMIRKMKERRK